MPTKTLVSLAVYSKGFIGIKFFFCINFLILMSNFYFQKNYSKLSNFEVDRQFLDEALSREEKDKLLYTFNEATYLELTKKVRINNEVAKVIEYRRSIAKFQSLSDILKTPGVDAMKILQIMKQGRPKEENMKPGRPKEENMKQGLPKEEKAKKEKVKKEKAKEEKVKDQKVSRTISDEIIIHM